MQFIHLPFPFRAQFLAVSSYVACVSSPARSVDVSSPVYCALFFCSCRPCSHPLCAGPTASVLTFARSFVPSFLPSFPTTSPVALVGAACRAAIDRGGSSRSSTHPHCADRALRVPNLFSEVPMAKFRTIEPCSTKCEIAIFTCEKKLPSSHLIPSHSITARFFNTSVSLFS